MGSHSQEHTATLAEVDGRVNRHYYSYRHHAERQQPHEDGATGVVAAPVLVAVARDACNSTRVSSLCVESALNKLEYYPSLSKSYDSQLALNIRHGQ